MRSADVLLDSRRSSTLVAKGEKERLVKEREHCYRDEMMCKRQIEAYKRQLKEIETSQSDKAMLFAPAK